MILSRLLGSNRTFMELKYQTKSINKHLNQSSNCTFMELNTVIIMTVLWRIVRSNCTFMELKYRGSEEGRQLQKVLIVPLWN